MAEAFVKPFKRNYVCLGKLESAAMVPAQLGTWFDDYNEVHPHGGLQIRSPREYPHENRCERRDDDSMESP